MPELIDTPVTLADFAEAATPDRGLFLVVLGADGVEQRLRLSDALGQILLEDLPADPALAALTSALAGKADKAAPFVDVASAATVDLGAASSPSVNITGTTTITSFGTSAPDGAEYLLKFAGALTVTHGASLLLPEATNLVTYAGMTMRVRKEASNVWRVIWYSSRLGISGGGANRVKFDASALGANITITLPNANVDLARLNGMLGYDQTWEDMNAVRAVNTSYQNTTGRPIVVNITAGRSDSTAFYLRTSLTGSDPWVTVTQSSVIASASRMFTTVVIPNGVYYLLSNAGAITSWSELR